MVYRRGLRPHSKANTETKFWAATDRSGECWVSQMGSRMPEGYRRVRWGDGIKGMAHRLAWQFINGPIPDGLSVLHRCDNPPCVNPEHLFLGTNVDNMTDMVAKGRARGKTQNGEANDYAKLTEQQVRDIRLRWRYRVVPMSALAREYGVSQSAISDICRRATWAHVT